MRHSVSIAVMLAIIWLVNSGHYSPLFLGFGVISVLFVVWIAHRMDLVDHESQPIHLSAQLPIYYLWLIKKIIVSNIDVALRAWKPSPDVSPQVKTLSILQKTDMGRVIYANSINLTPGTLSLELRDDSVLVHALTKDAMNELIEGEMNRRVTDIE